MLVEVLSAATLLVGSSPATRPATVTGERTCQERVEGPGEVVASPEPLTIMNSDFVRADAGVLQQRRGGYGSIKAPADVAAGRVVTLSVAPASRRRIALAYDLAKLPRRTNGRHRLSDGQRAVTFIACAADEPAFSRDGVVGPRTGYNGGFIARGRQCAELLVRVAGEPGTRRLRVGIGRRCPAI